MTEPQIARHVWISNPLPQIVFPLSIKLDTSAAPHATRVLKTLLLKGILFILEHMWNLLSTPAAGIRWCRRRSAQTSVEAPARTNAPQLVTHRTSPLKCCQGNHTLPWHYPRADTYTHWQASNSPSPVRGAVEINKGCQHACA